MWEDILLQNETCLERGHCHLHQEQHFAAGENWMSNTDSGFPPKMYALIFEIQD